MIHNDRFLSSDREQEIGEITPTSSAHGNTHENNEECCAAALAIDKDLSTQAVTGTQNGAGWIKLEFDKTYFINRVVIYYRFYTNWYKPSGGCAQSLNRFKGCVDNDNNVDVSVYQREAKQKSCGTLKLTYGLEQSDQIYTLLCMTIGNMVKLSKSAGYIAVFEVVAVSGSVNSYDRSSRILKGSYLIM